MSRLRRRMVSAANSAACSVEKRSSPASSSGRSIGVRLRKSQTPCRSGAPHEVRGAPAASGWAPAPAGANVTSTAAVREHAINRQFIFHLQDSPGRRSARGARPRRPRRRLRRNGGCSPRGTGPVTDVSNGRTVYVYPMSASGAALSCRRRQDWSDGNRSRQAAIIRARTAPDEPVRARDGGPMAVIASSPGLTESARPARSRDRTGAPPVASGRPACV